jgi:hypothetical protein
MTAGITSIPSAKSSRTTKYPVAYKNAQVGDWAIHSWGNSKLAAVSTIATLQLSATLCETSADKIAMNKAAEYLAKELASQIKSFQKAMATAQKFSQLR